MVGQGAADMYSTETCVLMTARLVEMAGDMEGTRTGWQGSVVIELNGSCRFLFPRMPWGLWDGLWKDPVGGGDNSNSKLSRSSRRVNCCWVCSKQNRNKTNTVKKRQHV